MIISVNPVSDIPTQIERMKKIIPKPTKAKPRDWNAYFSNFDRTPGDLKSPRKPLVQVVLGPRISEQIGRLARLVGAVFAL